MKLRLTILKAIFIAMPFCVSAQRIVGYLPDYRPTSVNNIQYNKLTDIIYSFAQPDAQGNFPVTNTGSSSDAMFTALKAKCAQNKVRLIIATGGYGFGTSTFQALAANSTARANLVSKICSFIQTHNLDGFDYDWEFPLVSDSNNYYNLIKETKVAMDVLSTQMGKKLYLSLACGAGADQVVGLPKRAWQYLDAVGIMAYDMSPFSTQSIVTSSWALYNTTLKVPANKLLMGIPFYTAGGGNTYDGYASSVGYEAAYKGISPASGADGTVYNSFPTIKTKIDYVMPRGAQGIMIWEIAQDALTPINYPYSLLSGTYIAITPYLAPPCAMPNLGADKTICGITSALTLNSSLNTQSYRTFTWYKDGVITGSNTPTLTNVTSPGKYWVKVDSSGKCSNVDTILVASTLPAINLGSDINFCATTSATLDAGVSGTGINYTWKKNSTLISNQTAKTLFVNEAGVYEVTVSANSCASKSDQITVTSSLLTITGTTSVCTGSPTTLTVTNAGGPFGWYTQQVGGSPITTNVTNTTITITPTSNTTYYVQDGAGVAGTIGGTSVFGSSVWQTPQGQQMVFDAKVNNLLIKSVDMYVTSWSKLTNLVIGIKNSAGVDLGTSAIMNLDNSGSGTSAKLTIPLNITISSAGNNYVIYVKSCDATGQSYFSGTNAQLTESSNSIVIKAGTQVFNNIQFVAGSTCARTPVNVLVTSCEGGVPSLNFSNVTKTYGDAVFNFKATSNSSGAITYSINSGTAATITPNGDVTIKGVGTVSVKITQAASGNFVATSALATITINKADLTITAENKTREFDVVNPTLTMLYNGFVYSDTKLNITEPGISTTALKSSNIGGYPITLTGGLAANYNLKFINGTLTISPKTLVFSITSSSVGNVGSKINLTISSPSTGVVTYSVTNGTGTASVSGNVLSLLTEGTVTLTAKQAANGNYLAGSKTQVITISKVTSAESTEFKEINIYPNPVKDVVFVRQSGIQSVKLYDLNGVLIHLHTLISNDLAEIKTTDLQNGYYILKVETSSGIVNKKILISK